jgi:hypothetical protein
VYYSPRAAGYTGRVTAGDEGDTDGADAEATATESAAATLDLRDEVNCRSTVTVPATGRR